MTITIKSGALHLEPNRTFQVRDGAGSTIQAISGSVWITEEDDPRDIVLKPGETYRLRHRGIALVNALGGPASVSLA